MAVRLSPLPLCFFIIYIHLPFSPSLALSILLPVPLISFLPSPLDILPRNPPPWLRNVSITCQRIEMRCTPLIPSTEQLRTTVTDLLKINHPILLAGMNVAAGPKLAAAVTNAGGLGVIGGVGYTPDMLREQIAELKSYLNDKSAPFGVDLLLPQVGGSARKTK